MFAALRSYVKLLESQGCASIGFITRTAVWLVAVCAKSPDSSCSFRREISATRALGFGI